MPHTNFFGLKHAFLTLGDTLPGLGIRLLLAYEFFEAGLEKWRGQNWFADIQDSFPFPFDLLHHEVSWQLATSTELLGALLIAVGLGTRLASLALVMVTLVAWSSVHAGHGYNVCDNGWKLPLIYIVMFMPLIFKGAGILSLDHWLATRQCAAASAIVR